MTKASKELVIENSLRLFKVQGYHNTSMADIGNACGLLKGSIYNYFSSKEALAMAVIEFVHNYFKHYVFSLAYDETLSEKERLANFIQAIEAYFTAESGGCLMGNLALEVGDTLPQFASRIRVYFDDWTAAVAYLLTPKYGSIQAKQIAAIIIGNTQGAIMMMRLYRKPEFLHLANQSLVDLLS
ncbi:MAG: TetR/AcrR family transcriptional regulator [Microcoleaceae cyanobacterium]